MKDPSTHCSNGRVCLCLCACPPHIFTGLVCRATDYAEKSGLPDIQLRISNGSTVYPYHTAWCARMACCSPTFASWHPSSLIREKVISSFLVYTPAALSRNFFLLFPSYYTSFGIVSALCLSVMQTPQGTLNNHFF